MRMRRLLFILSLALTVGMIGVMEAQTIVQIGEGRTQGREYPYNEYFNYDRYRSATIYTDYAIRESGGIPGRIARIDWQSCTSGFFAKNLYSYRPAESKRTRIWLGISPRSVWPGDNTTNRHFQNLIDPSGPPPYNLENLQLVYEGPMFLENLGFDDWYGVDFDEPYFYTSGHLAVIVAREFTPELNRRFPGNPQANDERGCWMYTRIGGGIDDETNTRWSNMQWWGWGTINNDLTIWPWIFDNRPNIRLHFQSGIEESFPEDFQADLDNDDEIDIDRKVVPRGFLYNQEKLRFDINDRSNPYIRFRGAPDTEVSFTFRIEGPAPSNDVIYQAVDPVTKSTEIFYTSNTSDLITYYFEDSDPQYPAAFVNGQGETIDGTMDLRNIEGGSYRVVAEYTSGDYEQDWVQEFIITYDDDMAVTEVISPFSTSTGFKYPRESSVAVEVKYQNVGLNNVSKFKAETWISLNGEVLYNDTETWEAQNPSQELKTGDAVRIDFQPFLDTDKVGFYEICSEVSLLSATDEGETNDLYCDEFEIQHNIQPAAQTVAVPEERSTIFANRPVRPEGIFVNLGISDLDNVPVRMVITHLGSNTVVYDELDFLPDLPNGAIPTSVFFKTFTPALGGEYEACVSIAYPDPNTDPVQEDNEACIRFTVQEQLAGTYTVGLGGDFATIREAVNAMYRRGIGGPVAFEFLDREYIEGTPAAQAAVNMSTNIIGLNKDNPVVWRPHLTRMTVKGGINIRLQSATGVGIKFGQGHPNNDPEINPNAVMFEFTTAENARPNGYMTFDGGKYKAIRFTMESDSRHRAAIYLGQGASNYTVQNCIIDGGSKPSFDTDLPQQIYSGSTDFENQPDLRSTTGDEGQVINTYSAGIVIRNTQPWDAALKDNQFNGLRLDTLHSMNNVIRNNEISGFGYGVVSLGLGALYVDGETPDFQRFYNQSTIVGNSIWNVARAGIYAGFEENSSISNNRIWNVGSAVGYDGAAAGIILGDDGRYNTVDVGVSANEISGVSSPVAARGIVVGQDRNELDHPFGYFVYQPAVNSGNVVESNSIWGLERTGNAAHLGGIHFTTTRAGDLVTPRTPDFHTMHDKVWNNTVVVNDDMTGGNGAVFGIGLQNAMGADIRNNAIAITGPASATNSVHAAIFYQGITPSMTDGIVSDRNAFWTPNASLVYMIEIADDSEVIDAGSNDQFLTLNQWRALANDDNNSVFGNFMDDLNFVGDAPHNLRVKENPTPLSSLLDNRGDIIESVMFDVDGNTRGDDELRYDIGADEFNGRLHVSDIEAVEILSPRTYRRSSGTFSDAEYVMTKAPIVVDALFRNGGSLPQTGVEVTARVYLESPNSNQTLVVPAVRGGTPLARQTVMVDIANGETAMVRFDFSDSFKPQTFAELGWTAPDMFNTMLNNVTPRYIVEIETVGDLDAQNNTTSKEVRFHLIKSEHRLLASLQGSTFSLGTTKNSLNNVNDVVSALNSDSLQAGLNDLELHYFSTEQNAYVNDYDILERGSWEPYGVNYECYRSILWSHDLNAFSRQERATLRSFLNGGEVGAEKNLLIASQEAARLHLGEGVTTDQAFVNQVLRAEYVNPPGTPWLPDYNNREVSGVNVAKGIAEVLRNTTFDNGLVADINPQPSLIRDYSDENTRGTAVEAYKYLEVQGGGSETMGISVDGLEHNVIFYAVDWRHFGRRATELDVSGVQRVLRGSFDEFENNNGNILPVELAGFVAEKVGSGQVQVLWETRSERNSARFDVERRVQGSDAFSVIGARDAAGTSTRPLSYSYDDVSGLRNDAVYEYRLRMVDLDGSSAYSNIAVVDMREGATMAAELGAASPNPAQSSTTIEYSLTSDNQVSLELYDIRGNRVQEIWSGRATAGTHMVEARLDNVAAGVYSYVLRIGDEQISRSLRVVR